MDDQKRIASKRSGDDFGDTTPEVKYYLDDHLGSSSVVLDSNGSLINREEYYPFGETSFGSFAKKRYRFCGKERDEESGLYYYGARYYAPWICRFVSVYPKAQKLESKSPYIYANDNPICLIDVKGLTPGLPPLPVNPIYLKGAADVANWFVAKIDKAQTRTENLIRIERNITKKEPTISSKAGAYFYGYFKEFGEFTDVEDVSVITEGRSVSGGNATKTDYAFAAIGIVLPVSGSTLKKGLKGAGGDLLQGIVKKVDNISTHLTDLDVIGAVRDIFNNPVIINGKTYDHLKEVRDALKGIGNQISNLNNLIESGKVTGDVLKETERLRSGLQKEKDRINNILNKAEKAANNK